MAKKYIIWGSSGHAKVLASLIAEQGGIVVALFDNDPNAAPALKNTPLFIGEQGFNEWAAKNNPADYHGLVAIGGPLGNVRIAINAIYRKHGVKLEPLIHKSASVCPTATLGEGVQILAGCIVGPEAVISEATILNHKASVDHECVIGKGAHLAPNATLCGLVTLEENVMIAAGATVISRIKIGANTLVGAGSVVTRDLPSNVVAYGNPAKVIRNI